MKKFLYIFTILAAVMLLDSCTKEALVTCNEHEDPFAIENTDEDSSTRDMLQDNNGDNGGDIGGVIDQDDDDDEMDEDNDVIVDPDENDDEMDEDDDEKVDNREGAGEEAN